MNLRADANSPLCSGSWVMLRSYLNQVSNESKESKESNESKERKTLKKCNGWRDWFTVKSIVGPAKSSLQLCVSMLRALWPGIAKLNPPGKCQAFKWPLKGIYI